MPIPKILHLCWLSGEDYPEKIRKCIDSWKKFMPDYQIILWDRTKFQQEITNTFALEALEKRKWAFAADYLRLYALSHYGGIYLDSDIQVYRSFNDFLNNDFFSGIEYFQPTEYIAIEAAVMGAVPNHKFVKECLELYDKLNFVNKDGSLNETPITIRIARIAEKYGFKYKPVKQELQYGIVLYPPFYFTNKNGTIRKGETYALHHCEGSWRSEKPDVLTRSFRFIKRYYNKPSTAINNILSKIKNRLNR